MAKAPCNKHLCPPLPQPLRLRTSKEPSLFLPYHPGLAGARGEPLGVELVSTSLLHLPGCHALAPMLLASGQPPTEESADLTLPANIPPELPSRGQNCRIYELHGS